MASWGMGWFGGGGKKKDGAKDAILGLRSQLEMLSKREKHLQTQIDEQEQIARKYVNSNKNLAKAALRKKKQWDTALEQTQSQVMTLEQQIYSIESANINKETLAAMQKAGVAMKGIHGDLTVDKVDQLMETLRDQHAIAEEIGDAITQGAGQQIDNDELEGELEALQQEELDNKMLRTGPVPVGDEVSRLPAVATGESKSKATRIGSEEEDEEAELRKLQEEMAM
ncbi:vacuolar-sorting protein-like protein snf7 [Eremomyces bilateralis CBS 781.70]|uniref:Vacuolar-sorting protein SNF7 n=1 Tax=Eremomyces bilateralis CBS 781.70 TaxID=1392243 RepID=A0A6G1FRK9_9PEZI|nr:vacuolar-sorting protein-like protein snf7 [Eremomyces bilateralis CBS 781.70]KAF1808413.1 vacuolar-sorting protein-like protein snf7 [Eremomyces bilateralis CBS 781.70]